MDEFRLGLEANIKAANERQKHIINEYNVMRHQDAELKSLFLLIEEYKKSKSKIDIQEKQLADYKIYFRERRDIVEKQIKSVFYGKVEDLRELLPEGAQGPAGPNGTDVTKNDDDVVNETDKVDEDVANDKVNNDKVDDDETDKVDDDGTDDDDDYDLNYSFDDDIISEIKYLEHEEGCSKRKRKRTQPNVSSKRTKFLRKCDAGCDYETFSSTHFRRHMQLHNIENRQTYKYNCDKCIFKTNHSSNFSNHEKNIHNRKLAINV